MYNMTMREPRITYIGWEASALELVGRKLLEMNANDKDSFRRATIVVPTAESGRRLKEWMAENSGENETKRRPLLMPRMVLAGQLIRTRCENVASELETISAWVEVLTENSSHEVWPVLFPQPVPERHLQTWALSTADRLMSLQLQLEQYEVSVASVLQRLRSGENLTPEFEQRWALVNEEEIMRWESLQELFDKVDEKLISWGRTPGWQARAAALAEPAPEKGAPIIIACIPELSPQVMHYLRHLETACPGRVRIWVNAPGEMRDKFDETRGGSPCMKYWTTEYKFSTDVLDDEQIEVKSSALGMARAAVKAVCHAGSNTDVVLGVCDASFTPSLVTEFAKLGWQVHLPEGRSADTTDLAALPRLMADACENPESVSSMAPLLRSVAMQRMWWGGKFNAYDFGCLLDKLQSRYYADRVSFLFTLLNPDEPLPALLQSAESLSGTGSKPNAQQVSEWEVRELNTLRSQSIYNYAKWVQGFVLLCRKDIGAGFKRLETGLLQAYGNHALQVVAKPMAQHLDELVTFLQLHPLPPRDAWALLKYRVTQQKPALQESARENTQIDALGWRELAYAKGSRIIITGLHEGCVPETLPADPFLPDSLRAILGLPHSQMRLARDAFLLAAVLHRTGVSVSILLSQQSADGSGTPVAPSALLYRCEDSVLPDRVANKLFKEGEVEDTEGYATWSLAPREAPMGGNGMESVELIAPKGWVNPFASPEHRFSPSEINTFLACPLRFWMKYALGISSWDEYKGDNKVEMAPAEYGTLVHNVLEDIANRYPNSSMITSEEDVEKFAKDRLDVRFLERFGSRHLLPTMLRQKNHIRAGLEVFVQWHCSELAEGWECFACEHKVSDWEIPLPDGTSARISMRADRIDHRPATNEWRIIDYKTHSSKPFEKHVTSIPDRKLEVKESPDRGESFESLMGEAGFKLYGGKLYWKDVQLPMYAEWLRQKEDCEQLEVAYFNLPRAGHDQEGYNCMVELTEAASESALDWARHAIMLMRSGSCLYSAESLGLTAPGAMPDDVPMDPRNMFTNLRKIF